MPRPRSLTTDGIAAAALRVIDREGLPNLSIRNVANELEMGTMSLYRYFENREQLEGSVVDRIFDQIDPTPPAEVRWDAQLTTLLERFRAAVAAHPGVVPLVLTHRFTSESAMPWAEAVLATLADAGLDGERRFVAFRLVCNFVVGAIQTQHLGPLPGTGFSVAAERRPEEFPLLTDNAPFARRVTPDEEFHAGLELLIQGVRMPV